MKLINLFRPRVLAAVVLVAAFGLPCGSAHAQPIDPIYDENVPGSFLVFPAFDIRGYSTTQIRIVNNGSSNIDVHLNYVCPGIKHVNEFCAALDTTLPFTPHQTRVFSVADHHPPCNQGFLVAYVINGAGRPIRYDYLTGSYQIGDGKRVQADNAIAIQTIEDQGETLGVPPGFKLPFGTGYRYLNTNLYTDFLATRPGKEPEEPEVGTRLTLLTLDVLAGMQNPPAVAFIDFWNAAEVPYSSSIEFICWTQVQLDDIDLNFLEENLGTTHGSMLIQPFPNCPLPGGCPPLQPYYASMLGSLVEYQEGELGGRTLFHDAEPKYAEYQPR